MRKETGWPEGYDWWDYLEGQIEKAKAERAEQILVDEIAVLENIEEKRKAFTAWQELAVQHTLSTVDICSDIEADILINLN